MKIINLGLVIGIASSSKVYINSAVLKDMLKPIALVLAELTKNSKFDGSPESELITTFFKSKTDVITNLMENMNQYVLYATAPSKWITVTADSIIDMNNIIAYNILRYTDVFGQFVDSTINPPLGPEEQNSKTFLTIKKF